MGYALDLSGISIEAYAEILRHQFLLPSREMLRRDLDSSFAAIRGCGIGNLGELKNALSTGQKLAAFSEKSGLSADYLTILRREIGSIEPKTVLIGAFPEVDEATKDALALAGLKSSKDYYEFFDSTNDIKEIMQRFSVSQDKANELRCLCDLVRINGVGAVAAKSFFDAGYLCVRDVAKISAQEMLERVSKVNDIKRYYKTKLGTKDMQFCIDFARIIVNVEDAVI